MKAFIVDRYGSADRVRASEVPDPEMREDDVLIEIHAAGVNPLDSKIRDGEFKLLLPYRLPLILGNELAGVVIRVGSRVRRFKPGDEVYARPDKNRIGTFAEFIAVSEDDLANKPKSLTMEEAASIPLVGNPSQGETPETGRKYYRPYWPRSLTGAAFRAVTGRTVNPVLSVPRRSLNNGDDERYC